MDVHDATANHTVSVTRKPTKDSTFAAVDLKSWEITSIKAELPQALWGKRLPDAEAERKAMLDAQVRLLTGYTGIVLTAPPPKSKGWSFQVGAEVLAHESVDKDWELEL